MRTCILGWLGGAVALPAVALASPPTEQNGWIIYRDWHTAQTLPCTSEPILLEGSHTDITLRGQCWYVRINGDHNDIAVQLGAAATIEIAGSHNDVTWRQVAPGLPPHLLDAGPSNSFHHDVE